MTRKIVSVSFNLEDSFERDLHDYALEQDKFTSKYIKRLIDKDRSGPSMIVAATVPKEVSPKVGKSVAKGFL